MGLKLRWFRARYNIQGSKGSSEPVFVGVYRGQTFEAASAAPRVRQPANATAGSSSHTFQQPLSSKQVPPPSSSNHKFKTDSKKKYPASSSENPLVGQSQPSGNKQDNKERNKSKHQSAAPKNPLANQSATPKNPLARADTRDECSKTKKPPQSVRQNMEPKYEGPVPKSIIHTQLPPPPPPPVTHDDYSSQFIPNDDNHTYGNSSQFILNDDNHTYGNLTNDNRISSREIDDNHVSFEPGRGGSADVKSRTPIPQHVMVHDESESET